MNIIHQQQYTFIIFIRIQSYIYSGDDNILFKKILGKQSICNGEKNTNNKKLYCTVKMKTKLNKLNHFRDLF